MQDYRTFGEVLSDLRNETGMSQSVLGLAIGVSAQSISNYENGKSFPKEEYLIRIADYFNISIDYLCRRTTIKKPPAQLDEIICTLNERELTLGHIYSKLVALPAEKRIKVAEILQMAIEYHTRIE